MRLLVLRNVKPLAEEVGFEPTEGCPSHAFQACRFGRSRTPPNQYSYCELNTGFLGYPTHEGQLPVAFIRRGLQRWSGPVRRTFVNRVRGGSQQLSADCLGATVSLAIALDLGLTPRR